MRRWMGILAATFSTAAILWAVTVNGSLEILGTLRANVVDFSTSATTAPIKTGASLPATCSVGQAFFKTDAAAGQNIYLCTAANTWTQAQGGGGYDGKPQMQYVSLVSEFSNTYGLNSPAYLGDFAFYRMAGSGQLNYSTSASDRIGATRIQTSTTAGDTQSWYAHFATATSAADSLYAKTDKQWELQCIFRFPAATDSTNSTFFLGMGGTFAGVPNRSFGIRHIGGTDTNFVYYADPDGGTWGTTLASGAAPGTAWHTLKIRSDGTIPYKMWIRVDNDTERSICPSGCDITLPSGLADLWARAFVVGIRTDEAAAKMVELDHLYFWMNWGAR